MSDSELRHTRIARDAPEIQARMLAGEFKSVRAAAIEAGIGELTREMPKAPSPRNGDAGPGRGKTSSVREQVSKSAALEAEGLSRKVMPEIPASTESLSFWRQWEAPRGRVGLELSDSDS